jgi:hypothetical protein
MLTLLLASLPALAGAAGIGAKVRGARRRSKQTEQAGPVVVGGAAAVVGTAQPLPAKAATSAATSPRPLAGLVAGEPSPIRKAQPARPKGAEVVFYKQPARVEGASPLLSTVVDAAEQSDFLGLGEPLGSVAKSNQLPIFRADPDPLPEF